MRATDSDALVADLVATLRKIIYLPDGNITAQTPLADLGLDSLDLLEASLELEAAMGREMPDGVLFDVRTVGDVAARLAGRPLLSLAA
jgi:acyl carrier protein